MKIKGVSIFFSIMLLGMSASATKNMSVCAEGVSSIFHPLAGGTLGAGARFEYLLSRFGGILLPAEYRFFTMSGFAGSSKFQIGTIGVGYRFYFSQLFWRQDNLRGFYIDGKMGVGFANETGRYPDNVNNNGWTFSLASAIGYSYVFDFGLLVGGSLGYTARGFTPPIVQPLISVHPIPELGLNLGWAF